MVADSGTLLFTEPSAVTLPNLISGTGAVTQAGPGTVTLSAVNAYAGGTTITAGTLALGGATVGGLGSGAVTDNATLAFTEPSAVVFGNSITGTGGVTQTGPGNVALSATNSYSGGTSIGTGAALILGASTIGTVGSGTVTDSGTLVFAEPSAVTVANLIGGSGGVQQSGPGAITLTNANSYTGTTLIVGGTLAVGGGGSIAASSAVTVASTNGGGGFGVLDISGAGNQTINDLASAWLNQSGSAGASVLLGANTADRERDRVHGLRRGHFRLRRPDQDWRRHADAGRQQRIQRRHHDLCRHPGARRPGRRRPGREPRDPGEQARSLTTRLCCSPNPAPSRSATRSAAPAA